MTVRKTAQQKWVSLFGVLMLMLSLVPFGATAQEVTEPAIELHVANCAAGGTLEEPRLYNDCHANGRAGVNIQVTDGAGQPVAAGATAIDNAGLGAWRSEALAGGQYRVQLDVPLENTTFFFHCELANSPTVVPTQGDPTGAPNAFVVDTTGLTDDITCDAYVLIQANLIFTMRTCDASAMPTGDTSFEAFQANCVDQPSEPVTISVRDSNSATQEYPVTSGAAVVAPVGSGDYDVFSNLDPDTWDEYLFCEYDGTPRYQKEFVTNDAVTGVTTFTDMNGEQISCTWFGVNVSAQEPAATAAPTTEPTTAPTTEATTAPTTAPAADRQPGSARITVTTLTCASSFRVTNPADAVAFQANCTTPASDVTFTLDNGVGDSLTTTSDGAGKATFSEFEPGTWRLWSSVPTDASMEYYFCSVDGSEYAPREEVSTGVVQFNEVDTEQIQCNLYEVSTAPVADPTTAAESPTAAPAEREPAGGFIIVTARTCNTDFEVTDPNNLEAFSNNCQTLAPNLGFTFVQDGSETRVQGVTDSLGQVTFPNLTDATYLLWSSTPMDAATEYYFCAETGAVGTGSEQLTDGGVLSLTYTGTPISCQLYQVPQVDRTVVTGSSVEMHLLSCPVEYKGESYYNDCHGNGIADQQFTLTGPAGEVNRTTIVESIPGPGVARFTTLPAGDYVIAGGPPQDFGSVFLYCSDPATSNQIQTRFEGGKGYFSLAENQSVICDWYYTPVDARGETPTPTPAPAKNAEIFTTMFVCPPGVNPAGATFSQLDSGCTQRLNDVPMTLQSPGGVPITANTGASGEGAIRFYDLRNGNYVLTPTLPSQYVSAAVYCDLNGGEVYQKALSNGATEFVNVEGELISCSWFVTAKPQPAAPTQGPTGSITIREMLCTGDRSTIKNWETECKPGSSGVTFTVTSSNGATTKTLQPNAEGVAVFTALPNEYYEVKQSQGIWCRAMSERVDGQSRVIVANGGNTDVFLYQCNQPVGLPSTGSGPIASHTSHQITAAMGMAGLPLLAMVMWTVWSSRTHGAPAVVVDERMAPERYGRGYRFR